MKLSKYLSDINTNNESIHAWLDYNIILLFSVITVTSCSCERVFSKLTMVQNKLRSSMQQDQLNNLIVYY